MPNLPIASLASLLYRLHASLCMQIIFSNDAYMYITGAHDRVQIFIAGYMLIKIQPTRFPFRNIEVIHTHCTNSFMF